MPKKKTKKDRDFQKVKFKVGKKLPKAENITSTAFKSKSIIVKEQLKDTSVNNRNQDVTKKVRNPQELLAHLQHYNASFRLNSLNTIKEIFVSEPSKLALYIGTVIDRVASLTSDKERDIRAAVLECLRSIFDTLDTRKISAYLPTIVAHLKCAMTHLSENVKLDSLKFLELLIVKYPQALHRDIFKLMESFLDLISSKTANGKRSLRVSPNSKLSTAKWRQQAFLQLEDLLSTQIKINEEPAAGVDTMHQITSESGLLHREISSSFYLSTSGLEEYCIRFHNISSGDDPDEQQKLMFFIGEILPLLRETWVELSAGVTGADGLLSLVSVVNILNILHQMVVLSEINSPQLALNLLRAEVSDCVENGFPFSLESFGSAKKARGVKSKLASSSGSTAVILNLKLCLLANVLGCSNESTQQHLTQLMTGDNLEQFGEHLLILCNIPSGNILEKVIVSLGSQLSYSPFQIHILIKLLQKQIMSDHSLHKDTGDVMLILMSKANLTKRHEIDLLSIMNKACLMRKFNLQSSEFTPIFIGIIESYLGGNREAEKSVVSAEDKELLQLLFSLLIHVDSINTCDLLKPMCQLIWQPDVVPIRLVEFVLYIVHSRIEDGGITMANYISFLSTILGGDASMTFQDKLFLQHTTHITEAILRHVKSTFPNSSQVFDLMEHFYRKFLVTSDVFLPLCTCINLLEASFSAGGFNDTFVNDVLICFLRHMAIDQSAGVMSQSEVSQTSSGNLFDNGGKEILAKFSKLQPNMARTANRQLTTGSLAENTQLHQNMLRIIADVCRYADVDLVEDEDSEILSIHVFN